ncbi:NAD(P)/FAD-dependent oxidoreductase, partial [Streptococcus suis]
LENFGVDHIFVTLVRIEEEGQIKKVITDDGVLETKTVVLAMGAKQRLLGIPGEDTYKSRGVANCAVCDGAFFRGQKLLV